MMDGNIFQLNSQKKMDTGTLLAKVNKYKQVLENTQKYRLAWHSEVQPMLTKKP